MANSDAMSHGVRLGVAVALPRLLAGNRSGVTANVSIGELNGGMDGCKTSMNAEFDAIRKR